jgi:hypothetical protein
MSEQLENELSKQPKRRKNDTITTVAFLDHPQHAGLIASHGKCPAIC